MSGQDERQIHAMTVRHRIDFYQCEDTSHGAAIQRLSKRTQAIQ
jgi:hypothetical protein